MSSCVVGSCIFAANAPDIRPLQAREYLYHKVHGRLIITPVVVMTSDAKDNHQRIMEALDAFNWFGRGRESFR